MNRGDVVLVDVPYIGAPGVKLRPALIVQNDVLNKTINETMIAVITSNLAHAHQSHQFIIDPSTPDGIVSGLLTTSAVRCERLHTVPKADIQRVIGSLPASLMATLDICLRSALGIR
ncbi:MAG TPA: type II toxin-antitoxin system PemK/MazF family toxin [Pirellulales bacterium]|nr:type II toxin-antitoxin system PemK/MazF family toxin [Pirellulales bacterium]